MLRSGKRFLYLVVTFFFDLGCGRIRGRFGFGSLTLFWKERNKSCFAWGLG